jgi:hypothetical protein
MADQVQRERQDHKDQLAPQALQGKTDLAVVVALLPML